MERHGIRYHEKTLGQLFCDESAVQIIAMLKAECDAAGVRWAMPATVERVMRAAHEGDDDPRFEVATSQGTFSARSLVVATGGLSIPKIGATPFGYQIAEQFGVPVVAPKPALVPLAAPPEWLAQFGELSGTSFDAIASCEETPRGAGRPAFRESALITHRGLSGPAILQISSYWQLAGGRGAVTLDLMPNMETERDVSAWLAAHRHAHHPLGALLEEFLPRRFARSFAKAHGWTQPIAQLSSATVEAIAQTLKGWRIQPSGHARLRESGSDAGRRRYRRALAADDGNARRAGALFHRRGGRRHRLARRLQLPVGVVLRLCCGYGAVTRARGSWQTERNAGADNMPVT